MKKFVHLLLLVPYVSMAANDHLNKEISAKASLMDVNHFKKESIEPIKGFVRDATGQPLIGVSVNLKGSGTGTQTDVNGRFTISANVGDILVFSYIGFVKKEVPVINANDITVDLAEDSKQLSEVVVTALGIKRQRKSLGYSVSEVKGDELTQAREVNVANSLTGKVAGLNVSSVSGGPNASANVVIRGVSSFNQQQPLYVVNGIPINNTPSGNTGGQYDNAPDLGDGIGNINPDDIETISVLKGAAAAALYGYRAKFGVILITTKSGAGKGSVEFNSNYVAEQIINPTHFQYQYGNGSNGKIPVDIAGAAPGTAAFQVGNLSWGSKLDGSQVVQFDGVARPYIAQKDNLSKFYRTGGTFTNTLSFSKGFEGGSMRLSASDLSNNSTVPNSGLRRQSLNFTGNFNATKRLTIDARANYINEDDHNRPILADGAGNSNFQVMFLPTSLDVNTLKPGTKANGSELQFTNNNYATNPWFAAYNFINSTHRQRLIASATARYTFDNGLFAQVRAGQDSYNDRYTNVVPTGTAYFSQAFQNIGETYTKVSEVNTDFLIGKAFKATHDITITPNVGGNLQKDRIESTTESGIGFVVPYVYNITNAVNKSITYSEPRFDVNSLYGTLEFNYKDLLYLDGTARSDWFSTLASSLSPNNKLSIIYPGISGSFVFSELWKPEWLDFGKLRTGYAHVGGGATPFQTLLTYSLLPQQLNGQPLGSITNVSTPNSGLKPSDASELEIGTELHMFKNRVNLDVAWYDKVSTNEILNTPASITSGYSGAVLNIGKLRNKGVEVLLSGSPFKSKAFTWTSSLNASYNDNKVLALAAGQSQLAVATSRTGNGFTRNIVGLASNQVMAFDYKRDASGGIVVDPKTGIPVQGDLRAFGSAYGKWTAGFNNDFNYKGVNLSILIDGKFGGKIFSATDYYAYQFGLHQATLVGRETGFGPNGVTSAQSYYTQLSNNVSAPFVQDASFIKFRQVMLGYTFSKKMFNNLIQGATLSLVGRNLFTIMKRTDNIDPEASYAGFTQGLELGGVPPVRTYGLNLNVKF